MNDLISVIVPVYNVDKYLKKCLESITNQTYKNLEIILVDDGSTDKSYQICGEYSQRDKRITFINTENNGVSKARNIGLDYATGKYILFIDSDDWLEDNMIECLYNEIVKNKADISICEYYINTDEGQFFNNELENNQIIEQKKDMYNGLFGEKLFGGYLWNKLIRKDIIDIRFNEYIQIQEDMLFLIGIIKNAKKIIYTPGNRLYHYRKRSNSAVVFQYQKKDITKLYTMEEIIKVQKEFKLPNLLKTQYDYYMLARKAKYIMKKEKIEDENLRYKINVISKEYFFKAIKGTELKGKIKVCMLAIFPNIYGKVSEKKLKIKNS